MLDWLSHHLFLVALLIAGLVTQVVIICWQAVA